MTNATDALRDFDEALAWIRHRMKTVPAGRFLVQYEDVIRAALATPAGSASGEDAKDAARYRWLRMQDWFSGSLCVLRGPKKVLTSGAALGADCPSRERLDAAIDAAMGSANGQG